MSSVKKRNMNLRVKYESHSETLPPICKLNDDCIKKILSYLPLSQLIVVGKGKINFHIGFQDFNTFNFVSVCYKWKRLSYGLWSSLNYEQIKEISKLYKRKGPVKTLKVVFNKYGNYIKTLNLLHLDLASSFTETETNLDNLIFLICKYCTNLKTLKISGEFVTIKGFNLLKTFIFPKLEAFKITSKEFDFPLNEPLFTKTIFFSLQSVMP